MIRTLLFNTQDVSALTGAFVTAIVGLDATSTRKGSDIDLAYRQGIIAVPGLKRAPFAISVFLYLEAANEGEFETRSAGLSAPFAGTAGDGLGTLTRRRATATTPEDLTALGRFVARLEHNRFNETQGAYELQFLNQSGGWTADDPTSPTAVWVD